MQRPRFLARLSIVLSLLLLAQISMADHCVERRPVSLQLAIDKSNSMGDPAETGRSKLKEALNFGISVVEGLDATGYLAEVNILRFCGSFEVTGWLTPSAAVTNLSGFPYYCGGTALYSAIEASTFQLRLYPHEAFKLLMLLTDGADSYGTPGADVSAALALSSGDITSRLVNVGYGFAQLDAVAIAAGGAPRHRAVYTTPAALSGIINDIIDATCINHHPNANITLSDTALVLGHEGFEINFSGRASRDAETPVTSLGYTWTLTAPDGTMYSDSHIEFPQRFENAPSTPQTWTANLRVTDGRGVPDSESTTFTVQGSAPIIGLTGGGIINVGDTLSVSNSQIEDIDGGGRYTFNWRLDSAPATATSHVVGSTWATDAAPDPPLVTTENFITVLSDGTTRLRDPWRFHLELTDNEMETASGDVEVEVRNTPPELNLLGAIAEIDTGDAITYINDVSGDRDGGALRYEWRIVQKPDSSSRPLGVTSETSNTFLFTTGRDDAGTWVFRVNVTDNEGETVTDTIELLVDAPPLAIVRGQERIGSIFGSLRLDASESYDPDSPCNDNPPNYCHQNEEGPVVRPSDGVDYYRWDLIDVPFEHWEEYPTGGIDEVFGLPQGRAMLELSPGELKPGTWVFQVEVFDAEGNSDFATHTVEVYEETGKPFARVTPPQRYTTLPGGQLLDIARVDGSASFDLDDVLETGSYYPGIGIDYYAWDHFQRPPGCREINFPSGPTQTSVLVHDLGVIVPRACLGFHRILLTVTDNDVPTPRQDSALATIILGDCGEVLCVDAPTRYAPYHVQLATDTDVEIMYRVDAALYDIADFLNGLFITLEIYHETDDATPVYISPDASVLPTTRGGDLTFHWNGLYNGAYAGRPTAEGTYTIKLRTRNDRLGMTSVEASEPRSIHISTARISIEPDTRKYVFLDELQDPAASAAYLISYAIVGTGTPDQIRYRVYDTTGSAIFTSDTLAIDGHVGAVGWDGRLRAGSYVNPGDYLIEIEALRRGSSMGRSARYPMKVLRLDIDVDANRDARIEDTADEENEHLWNVTRGAIFTVNLDNDGNRRTVVGARPLTDTIYYDNNGEPGMEDKEINGMTDEQDITPFVIRGLGAAPPNNLRYFLRTASVEDAQSIHVFKKIENGQRAILGDLGSRLLGGSNADTEVDITDYVNVSHADYVGAAGNPNSPLIFGIEGMFFRNLGIFNSFDGKVELILEAREISGASSTVVYSDTVKMKVAPWLLLENNLATTEVWSAESPAGVNRDFLDTPAGALLDHVGLQVSGQLHRVNSPAMYGSQWLQDHVETGYYRRPGGPRTLCTFRTPYNGQPLWPRTNLLRQHAALFQYGGDIGSDAGSASSLSGSFGGNLELLPPTASHPDGRIVVGDTRSDEFWQFLSSQEVQTPFEIPLRWLAVGHVDEVIGFTGNGTEVIIADTELAYRLLESIPAADRGSAVLFTQSGTSRVGVAAAHSSTPTRLETGIDLRGQAWRFVRIYEGVGAGQIARISSLGNGHIVIDEVWDTSNGIVDPPGGFGSVQDIVTTDGGSDLLDSGMRAHHQTGWFTLPQSGDRYVLVEDTQMWLNSAAPGALRYPLPAVVTVHELLADANLRRLNIGLAQERLRQIRAAILSVAGEPVTFREVPVLYFGKITGFRNGRETVAYTPNLANFQPIAGNLYFPRQFGAKNSVGNDIFEAYIKGEFSNVRFVDDWDMYHRLDGEVHCGTSTVKQMPARNWWRTGP